MRCKMHEEICPYCGEQIEINHSDGYGYNQSETHQQECVQCGKTFIYTTSILFIHYLYKADCLNGDSQHDFENVHGHPKEFFEGVRRCTICGLCDVDNEVNYMSIKKYMDNKAKP